MKADISSHKSRTRLILTMLMLIFAMPFVAAWFIYNFTDIGKGDKAGSYGELIVPPISIPDFKLLDASSGITDHKLYGKWSVLYTVASDCELECKRRLDMLQDLIYGMDNDSGRIQIIVATTGSVPGEGLQDYLGSNNGKTLLLFPGRDITGNSGQGSPLLKADVFEQGKLYIIDPLGNLMMSYSSNSDLEGLISDLKRLLRYSRIG